MGTCTLTHICSTLATNKSCCVDGPLRRFSWRVSVSFVLKLAASAPNPKYKWLKKKSTTPQGVAWSRGLRRHLQAKSLCYNGFEQRASTRFRSRAVREPHPDPAPGPQVLTAPCSPCGNSLLH